jgi:hypothetical protein
MAMTAAVGVAVSTPPPQAAERVRADRRAAQLAMRNLLNWSVCAPDFAPVSEV